MFEGNIEYLVNDSSGLETRSTDFYGFIKKILLKLKNEETIDYNFIVKNEDDFYYPVSFIMKIKVKQENVTDDIYKEIIKQTVNNIYSVIEKEDIRLLILKTEDECLNFSDVVQTDTIMKFVVLDKYTNFEKQKKFYRKLIKEDFTNIIDGINIDIEILPYIQIERYNFLPFSCSLFGFNETWNKELSFYKSYSFDSLLNIEELDFDKKHYIDTLEKIVENKEIIDKISELFQEYEETNFVFIQEICCSTEDNLKLVFSEQDFNQIDQIKELAREEEYLKIKRFAHKIDKKDFKDESLILTLASVYKNTYIRKYTEEEKRIDDGIKDGLINFQILLKEKNVKKLKKYTDLYKKTEDKSKTWVSILYLLKTLNEAYYREYVNACIKYHFENYIVWKIENKKDSIKSAIEAFYLLNLNKFVISKKGNSRECYIFKETSWETATGYESTFKNKINGIYEKKVIEEIELLREIGEDTRALKLEEGIRGKIETCDSLFVNKVIDRFEIENLAQLLNNNKNIISCNNYILERCNDKFYKRLGLPEDYITLSTGISYNPVNSNPDARIKLEKFLNQIFVDPNTRKFFIDVCTSILLPGNEKDKKFYIFYGKSNGGKSAIMELFKKTFGDYFTLANYEIYTNSIDPSKANPQITQLKNALVICTSESKQKTTFKTDLIKAWTGNDGVTVRGMYETKTELIESRGKLFHFCNHFFDMEEADDSVKFRMQFIPCNSSFVNDAPETEEEQYRTRTFPRDNKLLDDMKEMAGEFLALLVDNFSNYYNTNGIEIPEEVKKLSSEFWRGRDWTANFINDRLEIIPEDEQIAGTKNFISFNNLFKKFIDWHEEQGSTEKYPKRIIFEENLKNRFSGIPRVLFESDKCYNIRFKKSEIQN